jgi:small-conductance mechanosensitive channel
MMSRSRALASAALSTAAFLLGAGPARAASPLDLLSPPATDAKPVARRDGQPAPEAIPLPGIVPAAVEAYRNLAAIRARTDPARSLDQMLAPLDELGKAVEEAGKRLTAEPITAASDRDLVDFRQDMLRQDALLEKWSSRLEEAVRTTYGAEKDLERMEAVWTLTEQGAAAAEVTGAILDRARSVRGEVQELRKSVRSRLDRLLAAQDRVASLRIRILAWLEGASRADAMRDRQLFEIESRPIWEVLSRKEPIRDFGEQLRRVYQHNVATLAAFVREEGLGFLWVLAAFVLVAAAITWVGKHFAARAAADPELSVPAEAVAHPVAAGILVSLSLTSWFLPMAPAVFTELSILVALPSLLLLAGKALPAPLRTPLYGFSVLFGVTRVAAVLPESSLAGRLLLLLVAISALVGTSRLLRKGAPWTQAVAKPNRRRTIRIALGVIGALLAVSFVANVVGNVSLGRRLADGSLSAGMLALLLAGVARVLRGLFVGALRMPEVHRFPAVAGNAALIAERGSVLIEWAGLLLWIGGTLRVFYVETAVVDWVRSVLTARLRFGGLDVSLGDLAAFVITLWLSVLLGRVLRLVLEARLGQDARLPAGVPVAISRTVGYVVVGVGFLVAILASGMDVTRFTVILGTLSVGIGFGLQNVVNNFVSGLILLYERPIRVGDVIDVGTATGTVTHIGVRSSTIKTFLGAEVVLPNSNLVSNQLTNWTLSDQLRRMDIDVGVAYGSDVAKVQEILLAAARANAGVLPNPAPVALFTGLGDSALTFQVRAWTSHFDRHLAISGEIRQAVVERLDAAGIAIPFPQRDLRVVSVEGAAARALRGGAPGVKEPGAEEPGAADAAPAGPTGGK